MLAAVVKAELAEADAAASARRERAKLKKRAQRGNRPDLSPLVPETKRDDEGHQGTPPETKVSPKPLSQTQTPHPPIAPPPLAKPNGFARFWEAYPNKTAKRAAEKAYGPATQRSGVPDPLSLFLPALDRAKRTRKWREGFVPNPATWLNGDCWLDGEATAGPDPPAGPITGAEEARRRRHFADTGEWPDHWGERPRQAA